MEELFRRIIKTLLELTRGQHKGKIKRNIEVSILRGMYRIKEHIIQIKKGEISYEKPIEQDSNSAGVKDRVKNKKGCLAKIYLKKEGKTHEKKRSFEEHYWGIMRRRAY